MLQQAVKIAARTRREINSAGLNIQDKNEIAEKYGLELTLGRLPAGKDGVYSKDQRKIVLSESVKNPERINFSFCHELMHALVEQSDDLLSDLADASVFSVDETLERMCDAGAAELLMPSDELRKMEASIALIPELCQRFNASSIAVAFQIVNCAAHACYLVIAEMRQVEQGQAPLLLNIDDDRLSYERLIAIYRGKSPSAKYYVRQGYVFPSDHEIYSALKQPEQPMYLRASVPIGDKPWRCNCQILYFRGKVFAIQYLQSVLLRLWQPHLIFQLLTSLPELILQVSKLMPVCRTVSKRY